MCQFARALLAQPARSDRRPRRVPYDPADGPCRCLHCGGAVAASGYVYCEACRARPSAEAAAIYKESLAFRPAAASAAPCAQPPRAAAPRKEEEPRPRQLALIAA